MPGGISPRPEQLDPPDWQIGVVLVVEDDERSAALMEAILETVSRRVQIAGTAAAALDLIAESGFDLITIDIGLPDLTGLQLLHHVREMTDAPVIMVTAIGQSASIVEALSGGADDYIVKPVRPAELRARVHAVTRRAQPRAPAIERYADDRIVIDFERSEVVTRAGTYTLSATERRVLRELVGDAGRVLTHDDLLRRVWGAGYGDDVANLHVFISYLRRKLDHDPLRPSYIRTHRGIGYEFAPPADFGSPGRPAPDRTGGLPPRRLS